MKPISLIYVAVDNVYLIPGDEMDCTVGDIRISLNQKTLIEESHGFSPLVKVLARPLSSFLEPSDKLVGVFLGNLVVRVTKWFTTEKGEHDFFTIFVGFPGNVGK